MLRFMTLVSPNLVPTEYDIKKGYPKVVWRGPHPNLISPSININSTICSSTSGI